MPSPSEPSRAEFARLLPKPWALVNYQHDRTRAEPRCLAQHPVYGQVFGIYAGDLLAVVEQVEKTAAQFSEWGFKLERMVLDRPYACWQVGKSWSAELYKLVPVVERLARARGTFKGAAS